MTPKDQTDTNFVVYCYLREKDGKSGKMGTAYYIGKGRPGRPYEDRGKPCKKPKRLENIVILHSSLDEDTAFQFEKGLILFYGRKDLYPEWGVLTNRSDGGQGRSGCIMTVSHKEKISEKLSGSKHYLWEKFHRPETKEKISASLTGVKNHFYGKNHSKETKEKISKSNKGRTLSSSHINRISKLRNWFHPVCGFISGVSSSELVRMFPKQCLDRSHINSLANGRSKSHKGWIFVEEYPVDH